MVLKCYLSVVLFFSVLFQIAECSAVCSKKTVVGMGHPEKMTDHLDHGSSMLVMMHDSAYISPCCGFIEQWHMYIQQPGTLQLQVWRSLGNGSYMLVGENLAHYVDGEEKSSYEVPVEIESQIAIRAGDFVGWYSAGGVMVPYNKEKKGHGAIVTKIHSAVEVGDSIDLSDAQLSDPRGYAVELTLRKPNELKFGNLDGDVSIEHYMLPGYVIFTVQVDGWHSDTPSTMFSVSLDTLNNNFGFNASTGEVFINESPPAGKYTLSFTLIDHCGLTSSAKLKITVHLKLPEIGNLPDHVTIREDIQNTEVLVKEIDVQSDGKVSCDFKMPSKESKKMFVMRSVDGIFTIFLKATAVLNYAEQDNFIISVHCSTGKSTDTKDLIVHVEPNAVPQFTNLPAKILIHAEEDVIGGIVFYISAQDEENNVMSFNMSCDPSHNCPFDITRGGEVYVIDDIRSVHSNIYYLEITVSDMFNTGTPELLVVNITGINKPPFITNLPLEPMVIETLHENSLPGTPIYQVSVVDQDDIDSVHFVMKTHPSNMNQYFSLNETTGLITAAAPVDYESSKIKNVKITIIASDGKDSDTGHFRVSVVDENEPPVFSHDTYTIFTDEGRPGARTKADIKAKDGDKNDMVVYNIYCGNETDFVAIDEKTADITQTYGFDVDRYGTAEHVMYCNVTATDHKGLQVTVPVDIVISDSNDNAPAFELTSYLFVATRDLPSFSILGYARAFDLDTTPVNNKIVFYTKEKTDDFIIDENGTVYLIKDLRNVGIGALFKFTIIAEDVDKKSDSVEVTVVVLPGNYTTVTSVFVPEKKSFLDLPENIAWLITAGYLLLTAFVLSIYVMALSFECIVRRRSGRMVRATPLPDKITIMNNTVSAIAVNTLSHNSRLSSCYDSRASSRNFSPSEGSILTARHSAMSTYRGQSMNTDAEADRQTLATPSVISGQMLDCPDNGSMLSLSGIVPTTKQAKVKNWKPWAMSDFKRDLRSSSSQGSGNLDVNKVSRKSSHRASPKSVRNLSNVSAVSTAIALSAASKNLDF